MGLATLAGMGTLPADVTLELKDGASLKGDVIKQTETDYFLDVGFDILKVPKSNVEDIVEIVAEGEQPANDDATVRDVNAAGVAYQEPDLSKSQLGTVKDMIDRAKRGVVHVQTPVGRGAGFVINKQGYIISNFHVVENERYIDVTIYYKEGNELKKKKIQGCELIAFSTSMDISLIKIPDDKLEPDLLTPLPVAQPKSVPTGSQVFAIGNPGVGSMALEHTVTEGLISNPERNFDDVVYMQTSAPVNPGNSGGPLVDRNGNVVGLVTMGSSFQDNIAFALPSNYIRYFIETNRAFLYPEDKLNTGIRYHAPMYPESSEAAKKP